MLFSGNLFAALLAITAIGVTGSSVARMKREQLGNVYICDGEAFTEVAQPCQLLSVDSGNCTQPPAVFNGTIASFGPDAGIGCTLYSNNNCTGLLVELVNPGSPLLAGLGASFNCSPSTLSPSM